MRRTYGRHIAPTPSIYSLNYQANLLIIDKQNNSYTGAGYTNFDSSFWFKSVASTTSIGINRAMDVMTSGRPSFNDYNLGEGMLLNLGSGVPPTTQWTDPITTITYTFERFQYWDCTLAPFEFSGNVTDGDTVACDALYTYPGGNLKP